MNELMPSLDRAGGDGDASSLCIRWWGLASRCRAAAPSRGRCCRVVTKRQSGAHHEPRRLLLAMLARRVRVHWWSRRRPTGVDFGGPAELRVCLLRDPAVSEARVAELMTAWRAELAPLGITVTVPWTRVWPRPAFTGRGLGEAIAREPLEPGCDRLLAFIGRHAGDAAYAVAGFFLSAPEIFGWVDNVTMTRGFWWPRGPPRSGRRSAGDRPAPSFTRAITCSAVCTSRGPRATPRSHA